MKIKTIILWSNKIYSKPNINKNQGFTLIELIVTLVIISILAIISIPNLLGQVGKARETEAKTNLSAIGQSQQTYFLEKGTFADQVNKLDIHISSNGFYSYPNPSSADSSLVKHLATNPNALDQGTRNYAMGIYFVIGDFGIILCQSNDVAGTVEAPNTINDSCIGGVKVK